MIKLTAIFKGDDDAFFHSDLWMNPDMISYVVKNPNHDEATSVSVSGHLFVVTEPIQKVLELMHIGSNVSKLVDNMKNIPMRVEREVLGVPSHRIENVGEFVVISGLLLAVLFFLLWLGKFL